MRPSAPAGYRPTVPAQNPQVGQALPANSDGGHGGVVHSRAIIVLADAPFANTDALGVDAALSQTSYDGGLVRGPLITFRHYDGTLFYLTTDELFDSTPTTGQGEPWEHHLYSVSLDQFTANWSAQQAAEHIAARCLIVEQMAQGIPYNGRTCTPANWPWRVRAENLTIDSVARWCVTVQSGYPAGTASEDRASAIVGIPSTGADTETQALIGYRQIIQLPGERGANMAPLRWGKTCRGFAPLAPTDNGADIEVVPFEIGNVS